MSEILNTDIFPVEFALCSSRLQSKVAYVPVINYRGNFETASSGLCSSEIYPHPFPFSPELQTRLCQDIGHVVSSNRT